MLNTNNLNITKRSMLPSPGAIRSELPLSYDEVRQIVNDRQEICDILDGKSQRIMAIVGPCSIHDHDGAMEYAARLKKLSAEVGDQFKVIMRVYFEKPRTTVGWTGYIYDPDINGSYDIEKGIFRSRTLLVRIISLGLPAATEMLDPMLAQYIADAVSWAAIGARTTEAQTHRQLGSGISMPVGFKNATDGSFQTAIDAIRTAGSQHSFIGVLEDGHIGVFRTKGNAYAHIVLRGGLNEPNYDPEYIAFLKMKLAKENLPQRIVIDCSHANSHKRCAEQRRVFDSIISQITAGETAIKGLMLESYLKSGSQKVTPGCKAAPDVSVTDECIGWEETEELLKEGAEKLRRYRKNQSALQ